MNAGVVPLLQLVAVPVVVAVVRPGSWRRPALARGLARCAVLVIAVSLYWIIPSVLAPLGAGATVVDNSEHAAGDLRAVRRPPRCCAGSACGRCTARRGRGFGRRGSPAYLTSPPVVVIASFALPVLAAPAGALLVRGPPLRRLGLGLLLVAVPILMVGLFPVAHPAPFGRALGLAVRPRPFAAAFRTTNKAGAIELVGLVLLAGLAADVLVPRLRDSLARGAALVGALALLAVSVAPAVSGGLYPGGLPLPAYWRTAAADLQDRAATGRVWFVPGETNAIYRWGRRSVDDMGPGLLSRPTLVRTTVPDAPAEASNAIAAADFALQSGTAAPGTISAWARYFAAGDLLIRNDTVWEYVGGARPAVVARLVGSDPGLAPSALYGTPGEFTAERVPRSARGRPAAPSWSRPRSRRWSAMRSSTPARWSACSPPAARSWSPGMVRRSTGWSGTGWWTGPASSACWARQPWT